MREGGKQNPEGCIMLLSYLAYPFTLKIEATCSLDHWSTFNGLHGIISQKPELFITTALRTSSPTVIPF
jgi:hypothetical protein